MASAATLKVRTADHVEHDIDTDAIGDVLHRLHIVVGVVVDHEIGTECPTNLVLARRGRDGDPSEGLGDLDGSGAHTGGPGVNERPTAARQPARAPARPRR